MLTMRKKAKHRMIQDADCTSDLKFWPAPALFALTGGGDLRQNRPAWMGKIAKDLIVGACDCTDVMQFQTAIQRSSIPEAGPCALPGNPRCYPLVKRGL